jgi:hypothetical protein
MNRLKKEEARAYQKAREGLSDAEIKRVNEEDARNQQISQLYAASTILSGSH